jgi:hypothetical protein
MGQKFEKTAQTMEGFCFVRNVFYTCRKRKDDDDDDDIYKLMDNNTLEYYENLSALNSLPDDHIK